jgi:hypothetical protein
MGLIKFWFPHTHTHLPFAMLICYKLLVVEFEYALSIFSL